MSDAPLAEPIIIEPAANGVILSAGQTRKLYVLEPGNRSRGVHDLLADVAATFGGLTVTVQVSDPSGAEKPVSSRRRRLKLCEADIHEEYGVPVKTLQAWRANGSGPTYEKIGMRIYYDRAEVEAFFRRHRIVTTGEA